MFVQVPLSQMQQQFSSLQQQQLENTDSLPTEWSVVSAKLSGTELGIWEMDDTTATEARNDDNGGFKPIYINVADSEFAYETNQDPILKTKCFDLKIWLTNEKMYWIRFANKEDAEYMYSSLLLSQFEFKQLQESFTGALLSSKAIHFSDIRTLLAPNNKREHDEWCVVRFPFLNNKWIRCLVVVVPRASKKKHGKIEFYTHSNRNKKNLLASLVNVRTCSSVYPENPGFIDSNSLLRLTGENYINEELLNKVISGEINTDGSRSRSSSMVHSTSLKKKRSTGSLLSLGKKNNSVNGNNNSPMHSRTNSLRTHSRQHSSMSVTSDPRATKKMSNATIIRTHLVYLIPETHSGVEPAETMIRLAIPIMNSFSLYGRPERFISSREDRESLLFGLPQLPHTQFLDNEISYQLVSLNIENSLQEQWKNWEWFQVFKEMVHFKLVKGWQGAGSLVDAFKEGMLYNKDRFNEMYGYEYDGDYNPDEDFEVSTNIQTLVVQVTF
ncbi:unnamed protein product [Ambrosiozyma monospora]|uniref:Unnamed protein product n=1 Tax=Ambrosiozyma monospora TaxID=43982 RepID=A0A9W6Z8E5_AMBMO|nr:unnamed protein product [Ambrosiozyma monospora]